MDDKFLAVIAGVTGIVTAATSMIPDPGEATIETAHYALGYAAAISDVRDLLHRIAEDG